MCTGVYIIFLCIYSHMHRHISKSISVECIEFSREPGTTESFLETNLKNGCQIMQTKAKNNIYNIKYLELTEFLAWTCRRNLKTEIQSV